MSNNQDQISEKLANLNYDPQTVMVFKGTSIENFEPTNTDKFEDSTYIVVKREKQSCEGEFDIAVPSSYSDVTYPGALLVADDKLLDGKPQELAVEKSETNIIINLPGTSDISFTVVPTYKNVLMGINEKLSAWFEKQGGQWSLPANFQYNSSLVYDEHELALKFGCDVSALKQKLGIDFSSNTTKKKSIYIVHFKQIYYTVSAERPVKPGNIFSEATTWEDIVRAGVSEKHPPLFVKNVQYGRQIFLKFDSDLSTTDLETAVKGAVTKDGVHVDVQASEDYKSKLNRINVSIVAFGGSEDAFKDLNLNSIEDAQKINKIIFENMSLSKTNPAAPLNYYTVYLKDGVSGGVHGQTDYIAEKTECYTGGKLVLDHSGAYVARFSVSWQEITYVNNTPKSTTVKWDGNGEKRTAHWTTTIPFRGNVRHINIRAQGCTILPWEFWTTSGYEIDLPLVPYRKVKISGTTMYQTFKMTLDPPK